MANVENLTPFTSEQSREEAVKNGQKGGIASGKARRERAAIREASEAFLSSPIKSVPSLKSIADKFGIKGNEPIQSVIVAACITTAIKKGGIDNLIKLSELLGESGAIERLEDISEAEADVFGND